MDMTFYQKAGMSLVLTIISLGTRVLLSYTLAPNTPLGVQAIWWSIPIGWILADTVGILRYKFEKNHLEKGNL
jgi:Na+-driven multidrug efflux pump